MPRQDHEPTGFTDAQRSGIERRQLDQDRTLDAMRQLELALSAAAPRREIEWHRDVLGALTVLDEATKEEAANASRPDSLLSDISRTQPWLRTRVRGLRAQYRQLLDSIESLRADVSQHGAAAASAAGQRSTPRTRPLVGTPVPAVTTTCSSPST